MWQIATEGAVSATPVIAGGVVYAGSCDGNLYAIDLFDGESVWTYATGAAVPEPNLGIDLGISGSAVADGVVYVGDASAVVHAIDAATGKVIWTASPSTAWSATWSARVRRAATTGRSTATRARSSGKRPSPPGFLGGMEGTSAVADGVIAVPATDWPEFDGPAAGMVTALDAATGVTIWTVAHDAPTASPPAISGDVVVQSGMDGILHVYGLRNGADLFSADLGGSVSGGIAVADGVVVLGAFAPFVKPGSSIVAYAVGAGGAAATPELATPEA